MDYKLYLALFGPLALLSAYHVLISSNLMFFSVISLLALSVLIFEDRELNFKKYSIEISLLFLTAYIYQVLWFFGIENKLFSLIVVCLISFILPKVSPQNIPVLIVLALSPLYGYIEGSKPLFLLSLYVASSFLLAEMFGEINYKKKLKAITSCSSLFLVLSIVYKPLVPLFLFYSTFFLLIVLVERKLEKIGRMTQISVLSIFLVITFYIAFSLFLEKIKELCIFGITYCIESILFMLVTEAGRKKGYLKINPKIFDITSILLFAIASLYSPALPISSLIYLISIAVFIIFSGWLILS